MMQPAGRMPDEGRNWLLCVAGANACLIRIWLDLLAHDPWPAHRDFGPPAPFLFGAAMALALLAGTALWLTLRAPVPQRLRLGAIAVFVLILAKETFLAFSGLGWFQRAYLLSWPGALSAFGLLLALGGVTWRLSVSGAQLGRRLAVALLPLLALTFGNSLWRMTRPPAVSVRAFDQLAYGNKGGSGGKIDSKRPRAVWIILDELDEDVAFAARPSGLVLPALDRFRGEAKLVLRHAVSPANATTVSIPGLLAPSGTDADSVFARARRLGLRTGITGWALPYCEMFQGAADVCAWWPMSQQHNNYGSGWIAATGNMTRSLLESNQLSPFGQSLAVAGYVRTVDAMAATARRMAARADLDLVYLHLSPPHNPYVFNPDTGEMDIAPKRLPNAPGYLRNLHLADRVFAGIRQSMEQAGTWAGSIVIVTADHGFRHKHLLGYPKTDRHVPFMVKSPGSLDLDVEAEFATARTGDLLLQWLAPRS